MSEWRDRLNALVSRLEQERDELMLQAHLAKAEAREELAGLDAKLADLKQRAARIDDEAREVLEDIGVKAKDLGEEIKAGYTRIRSQF
jgi:gamma-glutamyl:cysteine ligase YbdK (ATP-grasp superfamily)